jgi:YlmC/YmxH family sporulation protein
VFIKTSDLRHLDVINIDEGRYLGNVCDVDMDPQTGKIRALIVDRPVNRFFWFTRRDDIEIPWKDVITVGVDVVLVKNRTWHR